MSDAQSSINIDGRYIDEFLLRSIHKVNRHAVRFADIVHCKTRQTVVPRGLATLTYQELQYQVH
jgi:hypothetical protein